MGSKSQATTKASVSVFEILGNENTVRYKTVFLILRIYSDGSF